MTHGAGLPGSLRLRAGRSGARTVLTDVQRTAPFHPGPAHVYDAHSEVMLQDVSPGIMPGDALRVDIAVDPGANLRVLGQGATKLYPCLPGAIATCDITLAVEDSGALWWLPGALIPFRDAEYRAATRVSLAGSARLALLEVISGGRLAMGERDAYRSLDLRLRIERDGRPILIERALLDPAHRRQLGPGGYGDFTCSGTLVLIGYPLPEMPPLTDACWLGADGNESLAIVRGVARSAERLRSALLAVAVQAGAAVSAETAAAGSAR